MSRTVFIVDDELMICEMIADMIDWGQLGLEVVGIAGDGVEAQAAIEKRGDIDVLITDIQMPNMNGLELMRWMRSTKRQTRIIVLSAYDDFRYLREAMQLGIYNYLLKPLKKEELETTLEQVVQSFEQVMTQKISLIEGEGMIRNHVLNQLIKNNYPLRDIMDKCMLLNIPINDSPFQVIVIDTLTRQAPRTLLKDRQLCQFAILNIEGELTQGIEHVVSFGSLSGEIVLLLSQITNQWSPFKVRELINTIVHSVKESLQIELLVLIGKPCSSWRAIHQSYESALESSNYRFLLDKTAILESRQDGLNSPREVMVDQMGLASLYDAIEKKEFYRLATLLPEVEKSTRSLNASQIDLWRSICVDFVQACQKQLRKMGIHIEDIQDLLIERMQRLLTAGSLENLWRAFSGTVTAFVELTKNVKLNRSDNILEEIQAYVDANFRDNLTLQYIALRFDITPSYLGKRFHMQVGESFNNYLNQIRIERAKQLLKTTRGAANEIAMQVGFIDPNYFYRQLKKYARCSPTEYRRMK